VKGIDYFCKRYNYWQTDCRERIQVNQPCMEHRGWKYWPRRYTTEEDTIKETISPDQLCEPITREPGSTAPTDTEPLRGLAGHLQQALQDLHTWREDLT
jgi:hypothetical protein